MNSIDRSTAGGERRGFTLFDLVGVLAITGVLGAIMFPVFGQVRQKASQSFCMAGRSQFIRATATYAQDYDEAWVRSPGSLKPYVREAVYACPTENWAGPPRFCLTREADEMRRRNGGGHGAGGGGGHHTNDLVYHTGGTVMNNGAFAQAIFWGPSWSNTSFAGDKMTGIDSFFKTAGGSAYLGTTTEYGEPTANKVANSISTANHLVDTSGASGGGSTSAILNEVCKMIPNPDTSGKGFYAVYTDLPRGSAGYCAWHSAGSCGGVPVQFAFFWNLDGDPGCDPGDTFTSHSQGLSALANVTGHELSETLTDPRLNAWFDRSGAENADKCAWTFNGPEQFNGSVWYIQGNWSNAAHAAGTSYLGPNSGCINGN